MMSHREKGLRLLHTGLNIVLASVLFWVLAFSLFTDLRSGEFFAASRYLLYNFLVGLALAMDCMRATGIRLSGADIQPAFAVLRLTFRQVTTTLLFLLVFFFAVKDATISRLFLSIYLVALFVVLWISNGWLLPGLARLLFSGHHRQKALLVGTAAHAARHRHWLKRKQMSGLRLIGRVGGTDSDPDCLVEHLGLFEDLDTLCTSLQPAVILFMDLPADVEEFSRRRGICDRHGARLLNLWDYSDETGDPVMIQYDDGMHLVSVRNEPLQSPINRLMKRILDIAVSLAVACTVLPPLALLVWLLHRVQAPGPLFFRQTRTGRGGHPFAILKFRTMYCFEHDETRQAVPHDARVFPAGRWLRRFGLDEFPQFLNVLASDMSIVGPRPHLPAHDYDFCQLAGTYKVRNYIKPGITGLAQVRGLRGLVNSSEDVVKRTASDLYYLEHWSVILDLTIIVQTAGTVLRAPSNVC